MKFATYTVTIVAPDNWEDTELEAACDALDDECPQAALEVVMVDMIADLHDQLAGCKVVITETA